MAIPVYVIGSSNTDMVVKAERLPHPGETVMGTDFLMNPGGKGANQAVAAARLGGEVTFVARVGDDLFGRQALQQFKLEKINTSFISVDAEHPSGIALIGVDSHGENSIMVAPGSNGHLDKKTVERAFDSIHAPAIVLMQLEIPIETVEFAIRKGFEKNCKVILNPAPVSRLDHNALKYLHLITPNELEAEMLTGINVSDPAHAEQAAVKLHEMGVPNVIITLGVKGAYIHTEKIAKVVPSPTVTAIDTTAAGDCFNGALALAFSEGLAIEEAAAFACKAAAISVTRMGAQSSMPLLKELDEITKLSSQ